MVPPSDCSECCTKIADILAVCQVGRSESDQGTWRPAQVGALDPRHGTLGALKTPAIPAKQQVSTAVTII